MSLLLLRLKIVFKLELMALNGKRKELWLKSIILPTSDGNRTVLEKHMDIVIEVVPGDAKLRFEKEVEAYFVSNGVFNFTNGEGMLIVDAFESQDEIDFDRAHKAYDKATHILHDSTNSFEIKKAEQALKRALGRLRLE
jgi:F-type H+-transporting ATPase subunit epsilon